MATQKYDVIIIGAGPGGEGAAMQLAKGGKRIATIEAFHEVGGNCTHKGTIPSKALRHAVEKWVELNKDPMLRGQRNQGQGLSFKDILGNAEAVIEHQVRVRSNYYVRNNIDLIHGRARFADEHTVEVSTPGQPIKVISAEHFVIATGSSPYHPKDVNFKHPRILDSDTILQLKDNPHTITIYGAGVIGSEYASIFANLGVKVNLINSQPRLLSFMDEEVSDALTYHMRDQGVVIRHNEVYESVEANKDNVILHLKSGKKIRSDVLLWANGRAGNSTKMKLEDIGVPPNSRGQLEVNETYQTAKPHIYAVGDIVGYPGLASAAYDQGRFAAMHILSGSDDLRLVEDMPTGIYTIPEISSVGQNENELTEACVPYEVGHAAFGDLARSQMTGKSAGMLKLIFHSETLEILGIHCFGDRASEIVHIGQAIMRQQGEANTIMYFVNTTFNYPTMAEAYRVAALSGLNRLC